MNSNEIRETKEIHERLDLKVSNDLKEISETREIREILEQKGINEISEILETLDLHDHKGKSEMLLLMMTLLLNN
jgi:hypothetical protein